MCKHQNLIRMNTVLAIKKNMSQVFTVNGRRLPATLLQSGPQLVTQVKSQDRDGYWAVQIGFGEKRFKNTSKPILGHLKGALKEDKKAPRFLREVRLDKEESFEVGAKIKPSELLESGDLVKVTGVSKGKGFAGGVKRHGFAGGPKTHGQSDRHRAPGSIGQGTTPGRVYKGKKMAGRMGNETSTIKNLVVLKVDDQTGQITLSGVVPGGPGSLLLIKKIGKSKKQYEFPTENASAQQNETETQIEVEQPETQIEESKADETEKEEKDNAGKE